MHRDEQPARSAPRAPNLCHTLEGPDPLMGRIAMFISTPLQSSSFCRTHGSMPLGLGILPQTLPRTKRLCELVASVLRGA